LLSRCGSSADRSFIGRPADENLIWRKLLGATSWRKGMSLVGATWGPIKQKKQKEKSNSSWSGNGFRPRARAARCLQLAIEDRKRARDSDPALRTRAATPSSFCPTPCRQQPAARQSSSGARRPARRQLFSRRPRGRPRTFATSPRCGLTHTAGSHCGAPHTLPARPSR